MIILFGVIQQKDATNKSRGNLAEDDALDWLKPRTLIRPDDQEEVPEADLEEEVGRILTTINPTWVADEVAYHYGKGKFMVKPKPMYGKAYPLYIHQGTAIRKDSDEAKAQIAAGYGMVSFDDAGPKRVKVKKTKTEEEEEEEPEQEPAPVEEVKDGISLHLGCQNSETTDLRPPRIDGFCRSCSEYTASFGLVFECCQYY